MNTTKKKNDCENCWYKQIDLHNAKNQHCYMFAKEPRGKCMQFRAPPQR